MCIAASRSIPSTTQPGRLLSGQRYGALRPSGVAGGAGSKTEQLPSSWARAIRTTEAMRQNILCRRRMCKGRLSRRQPLRHPGHPPQQLDRTGIQRSGRQPQQGVRTAEECEFWETPREFEVRADVYNLFNKTNINTAAMDDTGWVGEPRRNDHSVNTHFGIPYWSCLGGRTVQLQARFSF